ncbi:MAG: glycoside hydrolase family 2 protein [Thermoguttaceae bacterium]
MKTVAASVCSIFFAGVLTNVAVADGLVRLDLDGTDWQVSRQGKSETIPATVPGYIHTDLMKAKKIPDPFFRDNETAVQWVGEANWIYRRSFNVTPELLAKKHILLRCEGLDTLATVKLNGQEIGRTDNMFRTYEFDVKPLLKAEDNAIEVLFESVVPFVQKKDKQRHIPTWAYPGAGHVRKTPCAFGWDWGPTLISCGIWKQIGLVAFDRSRLDDVLILQHHSSGKVALQIQASAAPAIDATLKATVSFESREIAAVNAPSKNGLAKIDIPIPDPKLWWPAGMGAQPLYMVQVDLVDHTGAVLDSTTKRIGLRTLHVTQQTKDAPMQMVVNGVPFFAKGANWIPSDSFATRITKEKLRRYVEDAVDSNMNVIRFWGGGFYEEDALYDACDELGICVWQDFKFACSTYPSFDDAFLDNVKLEARDNLKRLRHHPCIAVWCGNNEIMYMRNKDKWTDTQMSEADYNKLFRDALGSQVRQWAPQSDYVTGSPDCGDVHFWDVWHGGKPFEVYHTIHGFVSEFGFQSFPVPKTIAAFTDPTDRTVANSPMINYHERGKRMYLGFKDDGSECTSRIITTIANYFRKPKDAESTWWLSQIVQGYGIKCGAEGWRREMPRSTGCVYWQLNDIWPAVSWSSIDYFGRWKALQFMAKKFYAPVLVSGIEDAKKGTVEVYVTSDRLEDCRGTLVWTVTDPSGKKLTDGRLSLDIPARKSARVHSLEKLPKDALVWLRLDIDGQTVSDNLVTLVYPKELNLVDPKLSAEVTEKDGAFLVTLRSEHPALWTWIDLDGTDARFSQNFIHLSQESPGQIEVRPAKPLDKATFEKSLRIRSLYDTYVH